MVESIIEFISGIGAGSAALLAAVAVVALVGAAREWWVWGHVFRAERAEKEWWREQALAHLGLAEKSVGAAESVLIEEAP